MLEYKTAKVQAKVPSPGYKALGGSPQGTASHIESHTLASRFPSACAISPSPSTSRQIGIQ